MNFSSFLITEGSLTVWDQSIYFETEAFWNDVNEIICQFFSFFFNGFRRFCEFHVIINAFDVDSTAILTHARIFHYLFSSIWLPLFTILKFHNYLLEAFETPSICVCFPTKNVHLSTCSQLIISRYRYK